MAKGWNGERFSRPLFCLFETQSFRFRFDSMLFTKWVLLSGYVCQDVGNSLDTCSENAAEHLSIVAKLPFLKPFGVTCSQLMQVTVTVFFCEQQNNTKIRTMKSCLFFFLIFFSHVNLFLLSLACFFASQVLKLHGFCDKGLRWKRPGSFPRSKGSWQEGLEQTWFFSWSESLFFWLPSWNLKLFFCKPCRDLQSSKRNNYSISWMFQVPACCGMQFFEL